MTGLEISGIALGLLTLVVAAVAPSFVGSIRALADSLRGHAQGTLFQNTSLHIIDVIESVVLSAEQGIEVKLKAASSDGVITPEEINDIVSSVVEQVMSVVGTEADNVLSDFIGDVETWIEIKARPLIADAVKRLTGSIQTAPVVDPTPVVEQPAAPVESVPATPVADPAPVEAPVDQAPAPVTEQPAPVAETAAPEVQTGPAVTSVKGSKK